MLMMQITYPEVACQILVWAWPTELFGWLLPKGIINSSGLHAWSHENKLCRSWNAITLQGNVISVVREGHIFKASSLQSPLNTPSKTSFLEAAPPYVHLEGTLLWECNHIKGRLVYDTCKSIVCSVPKNSTPSLGTAQDQLCH